MAIKVLLQENKFFDLCNTCMAVDGRNLINDEIIDEIIETFDLNKHIPYITRGHIWFETENGGRVGSLVELKKDVREKDGKQISYLQAKPKFIDKGFLKELQEGKFPHLSIEARKNYQSPAIKQVYSDDGELVDVKVPRWTLTGVAAIGLNAAQPEHKLIQFNEQGLNINEIDNKKVIVSQFYFSEKKEEEDSIKMTENENNNEKLDASQENKKDDEAKTKVEAEEKKPDDNTKTIIQKEDFNNSNKALKDTWQRRYEESLLKYEEQVRTNKRLNEDNDELKKELDKKNNDLFELQEKTYDQMLIIAAMNGINNNQSVHDFLGIPINAPLEKPADLLKYSEKYKKEYKDKPELRDYILKELENLPKRNDIQDINYGAEPLIKKNQSESYTDDELIELKAKDICKEKNIDFNSDEGDKIIFSTHLKYNNESALKELKEEYS